jgi:hypothetical protein
MGEWVHDRSVCRARSVMSAEPKRDGCIKSRVIKWGKDCCCHTCNAEPGHSAIRSGRLQIITFIDTHLISGDDRLEGWSHLCPNCRAQVWELILEVFVCVFVPLWWWWWWCGHGVLTDCTLHHFPVLLVIWKSHNSCMQVIAVDSLW